MSLPENPAPGRDAPGTVRLRRQVARARTLALVTLVLVVLLGVWSVVGIASLTSQVSSLEDKIDALSSRVNAPSAAADGATAPRAQSAPSAVPPGQADVPAGVDKAGAIVVGDPEAAKVVEVYVDYQCPYCQRWETQVGTALMGRALQPGSGLAVRQYNMAFLGEANRSLNPPAASARAANAAACVLNADGVQAFVDFNAAIFAFPAGQDPASRFDTASLLSLASGAGASDEALACIETGTFIPFVSATTQGAFARGVTGTPTVLVNGKPLQDPFGDPQLLALLQM